MTGSGKTTLAQRLLSSTEYVIVIDTKQELKWSGFSRTAEVDDAFLLDKEHDGHTIFRPKNLKDVERVYKRAYEEWGWTVYVDEVYQIGVTGRSGPSAFPAHFTRCLTAGRTRGVSIWTGAQRPKYFPVFAVTESTHFFVFELGSADDRKDLYRLVGLDELGEHRQQVLGRHEFLYYSRLSKQAVRSKLFLSP